MNRHFSSVREEPVPEELIREIGFDAANGDLWVTPHFLSAFVHGRPLFAHKGMFGRALLIAGRYGMVGASVLAARACLRAGVGLLTVHAPRCAYPVLQTAVPEAMVESDEEEQVISSLAIKSLEKYDAIGIGPGMGRSKDTAHVLKQLLQFYRRPVLFDADALNVLSDNPTYWEFLPPGSILTPHLGELERMIGPAEIVEVRKAKTRDFAMRHSVYVVVKGAFTQVVSPQGPCFFNTTGNPGMATAGSGDVLSGIVLSLLAQGYGPLQAATLAVYLHGQAGDIALDRESEESLLSGDIITHLGAAYKQLAADMATR